MTDTALQTSPDGSGAAEDFRTLWSLASEDIRFFKSQQFAVANYALALYAALTVSQSKLSSYPWSWILTTIAIGVGIIGVMMVFALQRALTKSRRNMRAARSNLSPQLIRVMAEVRRDDDTPIETRKPGDLEWVLASVIALGGIVSVVYLAQ